MTDQGDDEQGIDQNDCLRPKDRFRVIANAAELTPSNQSPSQLHLIEPSDELVLGEDLPIALDDHMIALPIDHKIVELRSELAILRQEHQDLSDSIEALLLITVPDQILIARLKRKKLVLKDRITELEDRIRPDIIA
jgi:hypothetical protein